MITKRILVTVTLGLILVTSVGASVWAQFIL